LDNKKWEEIDFFPFFNAKLLEMREKTETDHKRKWKKSGCNLQFLLAIWKLQCYTIIGNVSVCPFEGN